MSSSLKRGSAVMLVMGSLLTGCASSSVEVKHSSTSPDYNGERFQSLLVIGLAESRYRVPFEDAFVRELEARGVKAVASHWSISSVSTLEDEQSLRGAIGRTDTDAAITVRAEGFRESNASAWDAAYSAAFWLLDDWDDRRAARRAIAVGSAIDEEDAASYGVEVELWETAGLRAVWVARTDTYDTGDLNELVSRFADAVVGELRAAGLI